MAEKKAVEEEIIEIQRQLDEMKKKVDVLVSETRGKKERVRTFVDGFDSYIDGGIPRGHVILLSGPSGTMKSSLALYILLSNSLSEGKSALYVSLEETRESLERTMKGLGLEAQSDFIVDVGKLRSEHPEAEVAEDWIGILREYIRQRTEADQISLLALDSLSSLYSLASLEEPRRELFHFFRFLRDEGLTSFLISDNESSRSFPYAEDSLVDGHFHLDYLKENGDFHLVLRCVKIRHVHHARGYFRLSYEGKKFKAVPI